ncbi:RAN binding domain [Cryptosporidium canis]|uniref:RAN binding domain n=1 Tax=Cryptosporidium canis TaxID=195482 RepID=A0A9D5HWB1_9CRYT|nr:RAN binding domain [Cryptosporidium canis]
MSKRVADFQLTSENYELEEKRQDAPASIEEEVLESSEEISARRIVRIRKRCGDVENACSRVSRIVPEESSAAPVPVGTSESKDEGPVTGDQDKSVLVREDEKEEREGVDAAEPVLENGEEKKENADKLGNEVEKDKGEVLPFGGSGLSSSFKNPFISLAESNENSNFLFSGFTGGNKSGGLVGSSGICGEEEAIAGGEEDDEEANEEPEQESKVFTGEEDEDTVYQCKCADLFMLKASENEEKSFKRLATGIIHLNVPNEQEVSGGEKASGGEEVGEAESTGSSSVDKVSKSTQPRIIFRQKGIYKVLLNSPLNPEISKTFQRNSNIRKGYAVNFIAIGEESEIQQCMLRFQNESDLVDFTDKVRQIVSQYYPKTE